MLLAIILIYPPNEMVQLGFTIQTIFSRLLGSEEMFFVEYHVRRVLLTVFIHSFIPLGACNSFSSYNPFISNKSLILGYYLLLGFYVPQMNLFNLRMLSISWQIYLYASSLLALTLTTLCYYWYMNNYEYNPIVKKLKLIASKEENSVNWKTIVGRINTEFRNYDKFSSGTNIIHRVYITNNWLIKVNLYDLNLIKIDNVSLHLTHAHEVRLTPEGNMNTQYLNILVRPRVHLYVKPFYIRLNSLEYKDFKDKMLLPIEEEAGIVIKQSLPDQFLDAFIQQIDLNEKFRLKREVYIIIEVSKRKAKTSY